MERKDSENPLGYLLNLDFVSRSIEYLRGIKIHRHFAGYLCLCYTAQLEGRSDRLKPEFKEFFDRFLLVGSAPQNTPYLVPFNESGNGAANVWMNSNVAGSYAVSSLRPQAPLRRVADLFGAGRASNFSLKDDHSTACYESLLFGQKINVVPLAAFIFRDHVFLANGGEEPTINDLVVGFSSLFGFDNPGSLHVLFDLEGFPFSGEVWMPPQSISVDMTK
ncbi:hypothetical protein [Pseudomonas soli]|uniref:hypothetical protein n=1 Tax=Pseudomonas soli TaxID=1306993 RepID=UPI0028AC6F34|nr:hypothetical protein [Pseudomonas soli]